jgi:hypothetical protein
LPGQRWTAAKASSTASAALADPHADAAAAGRGLQDHREADPLRRRPRGRGSTSRSVPGASGTPCAWARVAGGVLEPESADVVRVGPMKAMPASSQAWAKAAFSLRKP